MAKIFIGVIIAAFVVIIGFMIIDPEFNTQTSGSIVETLSNNTMKITVEGEVYKPGTYTLADNATMDNLIEAAGGLTATADARCYFPTAELKSGTTYYIGSLYDSSDICNNKEIEKVNINQDDASKLTTINGITTSIASSIISYRAENTMFYTIEDILNVYGVGTATYRKVRNFVILHE